MQDNVILIPFLIASIFGAWITSDKGGGLNFFTDFERSMQGPFNFGIIVLLQALFGGKGFTDTPKKMTKFFEHPVVKFLALYIIAFSGTQDVEESAFIVIAFLITMQLLRNKSEREKHPYLI